MSKMINTLFIYLLVVGLVSAFAAVPSTINYQGFLTDNGVPVNGSRTFKFEVVLSAGTTIALGTISLPVADGVYSYPLDFSPVGASEWVAGNLKLRVTVNGNVITPDIRLLSVPFAIQAKKSDDSSPIGTIVALHPAVDVPDPLYWQLCDGSGTVAGSKLFPFTAQVPNIMDDRFLMGGTGTRNGAIDDGGNNDGHSHSFSLSADAGGGHSHRYPVSGGETADGKSVRIGGPHDTGYYNTTVEGHHGHSISGSIGSGVSGDALGANRPQYFKVKYYIKIN